MKAYKYISYFVLCSLVLLAFTSCEPRALTEDDVFTTVDSASLEAILKAENPQGYRIYTLNELKSELMTEKGDFGDAETPYRTRATNGNGIYLFSIDTIPADTIGIYIRGRVTTDDYAGNFYKAMVIQQAVSWSLPGSTVDLKQQNLRISVDMGSLGGMFQIGQEILIRCNGLAIGRYANQPQLCVPSFNNNIYASHANEKVGWAPGRIPSAKFRNAVKLIGTPDQSKLIYDSCSLKQLFKERGIEYVPAGSKADYETMRLIDGRLVSLNGMYFTGEYFDTEGNTKYCVYAHPDSVGEANVFAPTTGNVGYPQARVITSKWGARIENQVYLCCSNSEYCKFAYFFIPGAEPDFANPVKDCPNWTGTITGILGWYADNAKYIPPMKALVGKEWSITPRGIRGIGKMDDIVMTKGEETWVPQEFDPKKYKAQTTNP